MVNVHKRRLQFFTVKLRYDHFPFKVKTIFFGSYTRVA